MKCIGYIRVSTDRQARTGHGLAAQEAALRSWASAHDHDLVAVIPDVMSGSKTTKLHGREAAARLIESGAAEALAVIRLDRATRSTLDGAELLQRARTKGWRIVTTTGGDSADASRAFMADVEIAFAAEERRRISARTVEGLAAARVKGVRLGRAPSIDPDVEQRILDMDGEGQSARAIAASLTAAGVPSPMGTPTWSHSTVTRTLRRWHAQGR